MISSASPLAASHRQREPVPRAASSRLEMKTRFPSFPIQSPSMSFRVGSATTASATPSSMSYTQTSNVPSREVVNRMRDRPATNGVGSDTPAQSSVGVPLHPRREPPRCVPDTRTPATRHRATRRGRWAMRSTGAGSSSPCTSCRSQSSRSSRDNCQCRAQDTPARPGQRPVLRSAPGHRKSPIPMRRLMAVRDELCGFTLASSMLPGALPYPHDWEVGVWRWGSGFACQRIGAREPRPAMLDPRPNPGSPRERRCLAGRLHLSRSSVLLREQVLERERPDPM